MRTVSRNVFLSILALTFVYAVWTSYDKVKDGKIAITMKEKLERTFKFPSVTVCNYNSLWFNKSRSPESFKGLMKQPDTKGPRVVVQLRDGINVTQYGRTIRAK